MSQSCLVSLQSILSKGKIFPFLVNRWRHFDLFQLLMDNPCQHPIVILRDVAYADLKIVVDYMYKGEINVTHSQLASILRAAETLKVRGLDEMVRTGDARPQSQQGSATLDSPDFEAKDLSRPHKKRKFSIGKH